MPDIVSDLFTHYKFNESEEDNSIEEFVGTQSAPAVMEGATTEESAVGSGNGPGNDLSDFGISCVEDERFINVPNIPSYPTTNGSMSIWFRIDTLRIFTIPHLVVKNTSPISLFGVYIASILGTREINITWSNEGTVNNLKYVASPDLEVGRWYHLVWTWENSTDYKLYLDGLLVKETTSATDGTWDTSDANFNYLGGDPTGVFASLSLSDVSIAQEKIYSRALNRDDVLSLYQEGQALIDSSHDIDSDLSFHWPLDEGAANTDVFDIEGGQDGTLVGGDDTADIDVPDGSGPGEFLINDGLDFDGTNDYVTLPSHAIPTSQGTSSVWVRFDNATPGDGPIVTRRTIGSPIRAFDVYRFSGDLDAGWFNDGNDDRIGVAWTPTTGQWYHIAVTWVNGGDTKLYVDGILLGSSSSLDATWDTSTGDSAVGVDVRTTSVKHEGAVCDHRIYSREFTGAEILALFRLGRGLVAQDVNADATAKLEPATKGIVTNEGAVSVRSSVANDDGYGITNATSSINTIVKTGDIYFGWGISGSPDDDEREAYFRFDDIDIPEGNTIEHAALVLTADNFWDAAGTSFRIYGEYDFHASQVSSYGHLQNKTRTTANAAWAPVEWNNGETYYITGINSIIQEIVDHPGWTEPNDKAIQLFIKPQTGDHGLLRAKSFETGDKDTKPRLVVSWGSNVNGTTLPDASATITVAGTIATGNIDVDASADVSVSPRVFYRPELNFDCGASVNILDRTIKSRTVASPTITTDTDPTSLGGIEIEVENTVSSTIPPLASSGYIPIGTPVVVVDGITVGYDSGKTATIRELNPVDYGTASFGLDDWVTLRMNLGEGQLSYFKGKIKSIDHQGENNAEEISYEVVGIPQLADEIKVVDSFGDPIQVGWLSTPTEFDLDGVVLDWALTEPKTVLNVVEELFDLFGSDLTAAGISTTLDTSEISELAVVDGTTRLSGGFFNVLKNVVSQDPGVKVWYDDTDSTWKFIRTFNVPVLQLDVGDNVLMPHNWVETADDRYTAIKLYSAGRRTDTRIPVYSTKLHKGWTDEAQNSWTVGDSLNVDQQLHTLPDGTQLFYPGNKEAVYRQWYLQEPIGLAQRATKVRLHVKTPIKNVFGQNYWDTIDASLQIVVPKPSTTGSNFDYIPGSVFSPIPGQPPALLPRLLPPPPIIRSPFQPQPQPYGIIIATRPIVLEGNPFIPGDAIGPEDGEISVSYWVPHTVLEETTIRYPAEGYTGTANTQLGVARELEVNVPPDQFSVAHAAAMLRVYKDINIDCDLPVYGEPIHEMLKAMQGRMALTHDENTTGLETADVTILEYRYDFATSTNEFKLTSDYSNFVKLHNQNL